MRRPLESGKPGGNNFGSERFKFSFRLKSKKGLLQRAQGMMHLREGASPASGKHLNEHSPVDLPLDSDKIVTLAATQNEQESDGTDTKGKPLHPSVEEHSLLVQSDLPPIPKTDAGRGITPPGETPHDSPRGEQADNPKTFAEAVSFMRSNDCPHPEVTAAERAMVTQKFNNFFDNVFWTNVDDIYPINPGKWQNVTKHLDLDNNNPNDYIRIRIDYLSGTKHIIVTHMVDTHPWEKEDHNYYIKSAGINAGAVIRWDQDMDERLKRQKEVGEYMEIDTPRHEMYRIIGETLASYPEKRRNRELEAQMGVNFRPVGIEEMDALIELVDRATLVPVKKSRK